jgi:hypothetical protein
MLVARPYRDVERFHAAATGLLATLTPTTSPIGRRKARIDEAV